MICYKCKKKFYIQRTFTNFLKKQKEYLCETCYKKYPIEFEIEIIPLEEYSCTILSIFKKYYSIDYNYFVKEYNEIIKKFWNQKKYFFIFIDRIAVDYISTIEALNVISKLNQKNLFILTFFIKK